MDRRTDQEPCETAVGALVGVVTELDGAGTCVGARFGAGVGFGAVTGADDGTGTGDGAVLEVRALLTAAGAGETTDRGC